MQKSADRIDGIQYPDSIKLNNAQVNFKLPLRAKPSHGWFDRKFSLSRVESG